jgi:hypothetical protein
MAGVAEHDPRHRTLLLGAAAAGVVGLPRICAIEVELAANGAYGARCGVGFSGVECVPGHTAGSGRNCRADLGLWSARRDNPRGYPRHRGVRLSSGLHCWSLRQDGRGRSQCHASALEVLLEMENPDLCDAVTTNYHRLGQRKDRMRLCVDQDVTGIDLGDAPENVNTGLRRAHRPMRHTRGGVHYLLAARRALARSRLH